jgi:endonuclease I
MRTSLSKLFLLLLLTSFFSCSKEDQVVEDTGKSGISLNLELKGASTSLLKNHLLEIKNAGEEIVKSYTDLSNLPSQVSLATGTYNCVVRYESTTPQFDVPAYGGKQKVTVTDGQSTDVNLTVSQANFGISIVYTDDFKSDYKNYSVVISSPDGDLSYSADETRAGYFFHGPVTVTLTYTDASDQEQKVTKTIEAGATSIAAGTLLTINFKAKESNVYAGYYKDASNKTGLELKEALGDIISNGYKSLSYNDLWEAFKLTDLHTNGTIWDMYSDNPNGAEPYVFKPGTHQCGNYKKEGDCFNREHSVPKSWFNEGKPMYSDLVHLVPTDGYVNSMRSNYPFGEVGPVKKTSKNGSKLGTARSGLGYSGTVFEPIDAYKGDFARIYFYFVTRYDDKIAQWDNDVFSSDDYGLDKWVINMMLEWNEEDPVSTKEKDRNDEIEALQHNRNPYVDHPEFIDRIWGQLNTEQHKTLKSGTIVNGIELTWSVN